MEVKESIYNLSWNNIGKNIPVNYNTLIIPKIDAITKNFMGGDVLRNKIYNYIIYYFNKGIREGILESICLFGSDKIERKIYFKIEDKNIVLKAIDILNE